MSWGSCDIAEETELRQDALELAEKVFCGERKGNMLFAEVLLSMNVELDELRQCLDIAHIHASQGGYGAQDEDDRHRVLAALFKEA